MRPLGVRARWRAGDLRRLSRRLRLGQPRRTGGGHADLDPDRREQAAEPARAVDSPSTGPTTGSRTSRTAASRSRRPAAGSCRQDHRRRRQLLRHHRESAGRPGQHGAARPVLSEHPLRRHGRRSVRHVRRWRRRGSSWAARASQSSGSGRSTSTRATARSWRELTAAARSGWSTPSSAPALELSKLDAGVPVGPKSVITYTLTLKNIGNVAATNVAVTDPVPDNTTFQGAGEGGLVDGGVVKWTGRDACSRSVDATPLPGVDRRRPEEEGLVDRERRSQGRVGRGRRSRPGRRSSRRSPTRTMCRSRRRIRSMVAGWATGRLSRDRQEHRLHSR